MAAKCVARLIDLVAQYKHEAGKSTLMNLFTTCLNLMVEMKLLDITVPFFIVQAEYFVTGRKQPRCWGWLRDRHLL